jgi:hypothetical protein
MRLGPAVPHLVPADDLAAALTAAVTALGQRPAVTVLGATGRQEQGFASLAGWTAKGAHLLRDEWQLGPGEVLAVAGPPGWPLAGACLAAWWLGAAVAPVTLGRGASPHPPARVAIVHVDAVPPDGVDVLWVGDALDGTGSGPRTGEMWSDAVVLFPDLPPAPTHDGGLAAILLGDTIRTQRDLLADAADAILGPLGIRRGGPDRHTPWMTGRGSDVAVDRILTALAVRPLVTGAATVVVDASLEGAFDDLATPLGRAVAGERISIWLE